MKLNLTTCMAKMSYVILVNGHKMQTDYLDLNLMKHYLNSTLMQICFANIIQGKTK
jgi:hypothetical protein